MFLLLLEKVSVGSCSDEDDLLLFAFSIQTVNQQEISADMALPEAHPVAF